MSKKRKMFNIQDICRFCLNDDNDMIGLSSPGLQIKVKEFADTTSITIDDVDYLPKYICHICLYKLESWYEFRQQLKTSHDVLMNYLMTNEMDVDVKDMNKCITKKLDHNNIDHKVTINNYSLNTKIEIKKSSIKNDTNDTSEMIDSNNEFDNNFYKKAPNDNSQNSMNADDLNQTSDTKLNSLVTGDLTQRTETNDIKILSTPSKNRLSSVRRTSEQRLASTQRWAARKRALLAATGENETDTDSMGSDTGHLSPMKKARVRSNEREQERKKYEVLTSNDESFKPQTVQSEVMIGDTTFVVTSTLFLREPHFINQSFDSLRIQPHQHNDEDQNMDIIDALQLRRVNDNRIPHDNMVEKCLNIEVEGTELEALQKVQAELASFVELEIKEKLNDDPNVNTMQINRQQELQLSPQDSFQTLEQQLKMIVEKAIKKSLDNCKQKSQLVINKIEKNNCKYPVGGGGGGGTNTFPVTFVKAAVKSSIFQPKVVVDRLDPRVVETLAKAESEAENRLDVKENLENCQDVTVSIPIPVPAEKHICGTCGLSFTTKNQVEEHYVIHKRPVNNVVKSTNHTVKRKLMRCKRCHEIVDAELVKFHICRTKHHKCKICNQLFRTEENLLLHHTKTHCNDVIQQVGKQHQQSQSTDQQLDEVKILKVANSNFKKEINCFICDKVFDDDEKLKDHLQYHCDDNDDSNDQNTGKIAEIYQCAICGKILDNEDKLENHVEQHLFNDTDDNPDLIDVTTSVQTSTSTASTTTPPTTTTDHTRKIKSDMHSCLQCNEKFQTEIKLALHMQEHEEEAAIAEWEDEFKTHDLHACTICYDTFDNEQQLADHFDIHSCSSHVCVLCDKPFLTLAELQQHVNTH